MERSATSTIAWIFFAIYFWDKSPVTRLEIAEAADALNHLVPLESELDLALTFLVQNELVRKIDDSFSITGAGKLVLEQADKSATNVYDAMKALELVLSSSRAV